LILARPHPNIRSNNGRAHSIRYLPVAIDMPEHAQSFTSIIWRNDDCYSRRNLV